MARLKLEALSGKYLGEEGSVLVSVDKFSSTRAKILLQRCLDQENLTKKSIHCVIVDADSHSFAAFEGEQRQSGGEGDSEMIKNMQVLYPVPSGCVAATQIKVEEFRLPRSKEELLIAEDHRLCYTSTYLFKLSSASPGIKLSLFVEDKKLNRMRCFEYAKVDNVCRKYTEKELRFHKKILLTNEDIVVYCEDEMPSQDNYIFNLTAADLQENFSVVKTDGDSNDKSSLHENSSFDKVEMMAYLSSQDDQWLLEMSSEVDKQQEKSSHQDDSRCSSFKVKMSSLEKYLVSSSAFRKV